MQTQRIAKFVQICQNIEFTNPVLFLRYGIATKWCSSRAIHVEIIRELLNSSHSSSPITETLISYMFSLLASFVLLQFKTLNIIPIDLFLFPMHMKVARLRASNLFW
jgi:hypothetical protein